MFLPRHVVKDQGTWERVRLEKVRDAQEGGSEGCRLTLVCTFCVPLELRVTPRGVWDWDWKLWSFWEIKHQGWCTSRSARGCAYSGRSIVTGYKFWRIEERWAPLYVDWFGVATHWYLGHRQFTGHSFWIAKEKNSSLAQSPKKMFANFFLILFP